MKRRLRWASLTLGALLCLDAIAQEVQRVSGYIYSYRSADGVLTYTSTTPPPGSSEIRRIRYSYDEVTRPSAPTIPSRYGGTRRFGPYVCTQDCSGHEAGYRWAERRSITDPRQCGGRSQSFIEGCMAYAEGY